MASVKRRRRLRKLVPDPELLRRRAAREPLRALACDYGVTHTTLMRYFARPELASLLKQVEKQLRLEKRRAAAEKTRLGQEVRRLAREQAARKREQERSARAAASNAAPRRGSAPSPPAWDERTVRRPVPRGDFRTLNDQVADGVVAAGGGIQDVIDATGLHTEKNVVRLIDAAILKRALDNDALKPAAPPV